MTSGSADVAAGVNAMSNISLLLEEYCLHNLEDKHCESFRYESSITIEDINYLYLNGTPPSHQVYITVMGGYALGSLSILGAIANLLALICCLLVTTWSRNHVYITFITVINIVYILVCSGTGSLQSLSLIEPALVLRKSLFCMLWPALIDTVEHTGCWLVAVLAVELVSETREQSVTNRPSVKSTQTKTIQAKLKCSAILIIMVFLNYHSALIRDLLETNKTCKVSSKAGVFYRNYWPWIKSTAGIYIPIVLGVVSTCVVCVSSKYKTQVHTNKPTQQVNLLFITCYLLLTLTARVVLHIIQYKLQPPMYTESSDAAYSSTESMNALLVWLSAEIIDALKHSVSGVFIILLCVRDIQCCRKTMAITSSLPTKTKTNENGNGDTERGKGADYSLTEYEANI